MAPSSTLVRDPPTSRWFRRSAPLWILLGIALLMSIPGVLSGPDDLDATSDDTEPRTVSQFVLSEDAYPRTQRMMERRARH
jgi:hypothetical protein